MQMKTAFVFPGQGSQALGMLSDFLPHYSSVTDTFTEVSDTLGYDVWALIQNGPLETLNQTEYTQVAMLTADIAIFTVLRQQGFPLPLMMAGHSLGEYAALVAANALSLKDAASLVAERGRLMQKALPLGYGAMAAIVGLSDVEVQALCQEISKPEQVVTPANYNAIGQVVVAGHTKAVEAVVELASQKGALLAKLIPVSVPCHCPLLTDMAAAFTNTLEAVTFKTPEVPVISNVDVSTYADAAQIRAKLSRQLYSPVRWVETIQSFKKQDITRIIECGPGKVLSGLVKRIDRDLTAVSIYDTISLDELMDKELTCQR
jgi:[acyl-carrier-protein] S-malonyltransferase